MPLTFETWLVIQEAIDLLADRKTDASDVFDEVERLLQLAKTWNGDTYPAEGEFLELAAAVIGKKPVAIVRLHATSSHPALMSRRDPQQAKVGPSRDGLIQRLLLKKGAERPDFAILPLKGMTHGWLACGEERAAREVSRLYDLQQELTVRSSGKVPPNARQILKSAYNRVRTASCPLGEYGFTCGILHRHIGKHLGYRDRDVEDFVQATAPDDLPAVKTKFVSEIPFGLRAPGGGLASGTDKRTLADV